MAGKEKAKKHKLKKDKFKVDKKFLKKYLNSVSPTGFEYELGGQKVWMDRTEEFCNEMHLDNYGTAYGIVRGQGQMKVVIEAHVDEISWLVSYITPNGYIKVKRNGGSDTLIAPSMRVNLWGEKGKVEGVFGHPAIHIRERQTEANLQSIFIDVGADSKEDVENMGINVGTVVTFQDGFSELGKNYYMGRALDNRIGGFMISEVARKLKENKVKLPFDLYIVNAVQEEIGLRGASMIAKEINPDVAIVTDVCHETQSPCYSAPRDGDFKAGQGGVITVAPAVQNNLRKLVIDTAKDKEIPFQRAASSSSTGTDTDAFAYAGTGTPSVLISLPLKYMHTTVETAHKKDVQYTIDLIYESLLNIEEDHDFKYNR